MTPDQYKKLLPKPKRSQQEYKLQRAVVDYLKTAVPHVLVTHAGKGKSKKDGMFLKRMGYRAGTPDLLLWWDTPLGEGTITAAGIELKAPDGRISDEQDTFDFLFRRMGGLFACCKSKAEVHRHLLNWGLSPLHGPGIEPDYSTKEEKIQRVIDYYRS